MDKNRDGERGEKRGREGSAPSRLDLASAVDAIYANMLGAAGGHSAYSAAAAAAAMGLGSMPPGYPPVSSSAGLASLAAAQQAQQAQQAQAAALASLGPSAAWWNLAGLQQMELLSRLQGGLGGYPGLHPEHLMNLEILQAQHAAAAMAAALSASKSSSSASRTSSNGSTSSTGSATVKPGGSGSRSSGGVSGSGGRSSHSSRDNRGARDRDRDHHPPRGSAGGFGGASISSRLLEAESNNRLSQRGSSGSSHHSSDSGISVRSDLGSTSGSLSYGIASLMADKIPSTHHKSSHRNAPSSMPSDVIRSKELEIIPLSPSMAHHASKDPLKGLYPHPDRSLLLPHSSSDSASKRHGPAHQQEGAGLGTGGRANLLFSQSDSTSPKVSISSLTNGLPGAMSTPPPSLWKEENANVSIEPLGGRGSPQDDAPLNLSLKAGSNKSEKNEKRHSKEPSSNPTDLLSKLKPPLNPFDYPQGLGLGMGLMPPEMAPSLEVLQSLYGHHGEPRDVLASMQEALQRQLLVADSKKREEKKRRSRNNSSVEEASEKVRHLGRGVSKPKKNTVASLLEHCRAVGIKPQLPLPPPAPPTSSAPSTPVPPTTSLANTPITTSPPLSTQSLPPSLIPIFPSPPTPSVSISPYPPPHTSTSSSSPPSSLPPLSLPPSLSISSISSPKPASPVSVGGATAPSVTVQPYSARLSSKEPSVEENKVEITAVTGTPTIPSLSSLTALGASILSSGEAKRHLGASSSDSPGGRLSSLKGLGFNLLHGLDYSEMSDSDSDDSTSVSSMDDEPSHASFPAPWLKMDSATDAAHGGSPPTKKRKMITDERSLRVPLMYGWRRETTMRGITQSGVRGEVIYYAPCGKAFKQYPDIIRYLERQNIAQVTRDNFSFSSKITVGEYIDANTQQRYSEQKIRDIVREIKLKKGLRAHQQQQAKKQEASLSGSTSAKLAALQEKAAKEGAAPGQGHLEAEAESILRRLEAEDRAKIARMESLSKMEEQRNLRAWKEQEKLKKQEELRKEKEEQRKQREEINRQRLFEQLKKAQEREQEKQKQKIMKEQERERRRYHGILVRTLEARKRYEEREKRRECLREEKRVFKERKKEERLAARELNLLLKEVKEDMELTDHHLLPDIPPVEGLRLPPEAFGNVLMIFEFLHNFGETLGFDMESLPSLHSLQLAFLGESESEEELLSVLTHLLVCAIEDPGIPNSQRNTTILGQTLNRADITHSNISEILRVYFYANATGEVRTMFGLQGTEKERRETPGKAQEWDSRMNDNDANRMSIWLMKVPFLALNPTQKSEVVGYVCNELLQNKAVVKQIEDSLDRHNGLKTEKWKLDARIRSLSRRLRTSLSRKRMFATAMQRIGDNHRDDSNLSTMSSLSSSLWEVDKGGEKKEESKMKEEEEDDEDDDNENESGNDSDGMEESHAPDEEEDKNLNPDEATKTLEHLQKQMDQVRQELFETSQQVRGYNAGQDRYQRTLWILPHAGGPFMEGIKSCDYVGRKHFSLEVPEPSPKVGLTLEEVTALQKKLNVGSEQKLMEIKPDVKEEKPAAEIGIKRETVKDEVKVEAKEDMVNGEPELRGASPPKEEKKPDMRETVKTESESELDSLRLKEEPTAKDTPPTPTDSGVDKDLVATGLGLIPGQYLRPEHVAQCEKLTFSLLPRLPCDPSSISCVLPSPTHPVDTPKGGETPSPLPANPNSPFVSSNGSTPLTSLTPILQNSLVSNSMSHQELLDKLHQTAEALPIPPEYKTGWWHFQDFKMLQEMVTSLNERGNRESELKRFLERNINIVKNTLAKTDPEATLIEPVAEEEDILYDTLGFPAQNEASHWSVDITLKVDMQALEAVYALEEKITNASMQNKNWRLTENNERPSYDFVPSCTPTPQGENKKNPIHLGRELLLSLEEGIERRYLKPPLGTLPVPKSENGVEVKGGTCDSPKGLGHWKEAVAGCETGAQLAMCTYMLETAVAWDKSIMKAFCQFCHSGDFEEKLLLCDGCDRGYHTHCFKPPMEKIPEGDWYCYECVNKFSDSSQRHCLVCGGTEGRTLIHCASCPRAYHTTCINPPLTKVPRNKWNCPACFSKSPRGRRGRTKKTPEGSNTPTPVVTPSKTSSPTDSAPPTPTINQNSGGPTPTQTNCASPPKHAAPETPSDPIVPVTTPGEVAPSVSPPISNTIQPTTLPPPQSPPNNVISSASPTSPPPAPPVTLPTSPIPLPNSTPNGNALPTSPVAANPNATPPAAPNTPKKERGLKKKDIRELSVCKVIQKDLMEHEDSWPFQMPVNTRQFPTYKKIIKKPIDLSTINKRLEDTCYKSKEDYSEDLRLMFNNCETFNEDDSPVGKAGHNLRSFFEARWNENFLPT